MAPNSGLRPTFVVTIYVLILATSLLGEAALGFPNPKALAACLLVAGALGLKWGPIQLLPPHPRLDEGRLWGYLFAVPGIIAVIHFQVDEVHAYCFSMASVSAWTLGQQAHLARQPKRRRKRKRQG